VLLDCGCRRFCPEEKASAPHDIVTFFFPSSFLNAAENRWRL